MLWLRKILGLNYPPAAAMVEDTGVRVRVDDKGVTFSLAVDAPETSIAWERIARVVVETTDAGPFAADLFWQIEDASGHGLTVPMGTHGERELLKAMQQHLEGFDNMAVVEAMGSTDHARFTVWEADAE